MVPRNLYRAISLVDPNDSHPRKWWLPTAGKNRNDPLSRRIFASGGLKDWPRLPLPRGTATTSMMIVASGLIVGGLHMFFTRQSSYNEERKFFVEKRSLQFIKYFFLIWWFLYFLNLVDLREGLYLWLN